MPYKLFRISNGYQPVSLNGTFRRLMRDSCLLKDDAGQTRTLYSLRQTYATLELLNNSTDIHILSKQMGNSAAMIERHYSKGMRLKTWTTWMQLNEFKEVPNTRIAI